MTGTGVAGAAEALEGERYDEVLRLTDTILAETPGNDAAHEYGPRPAGPRPPR